jgi:hypothetical protein
MRLFPSQVPVHSAHNEVAVVHYRWHPLFGKEIRIAYREHRNCEDVVVFETTDRARTILPAWMLDAGACAAMSMGQACVAISALLELCAELKALGFDRGASPVGEQERIDESPTAGTVTARAVASPPRPYRSRAERAARDPSYIGGHLTIGRRRARAKGGAR